MKKFVLVSAALAVIAAASAPAWAGMMCGPNGAPLACPMPGAGSGARVAALLVSAAAGYAVLVLAAKQTRRLAMTGKILGWFIIVVSVLGLAWSAVACLKAHCRMKSMPAVCPMASAVPEKTK